MKEKEPVRQDTAANREGKWAEREPVTSDSIKNAHASGDGAMGRSLDSIPDEEELEKRGKAPGRPTEHY
jgi:hypothetical protein